MSPRHSERTANPVCKLPTIRQLVDRSISSHYNAFDCNQWRSRTTAMDYSALSRTWPPLHCLLGCQLVFLYFLILYHLLAMTTTTSRRRTHTHLICPLDSVLLLPSQEGTMNYCLLQCGFRSSVFLANRGRPDRPGWTPQSMHLAPVGSLCQSNKHTRLQV